MACKKYMTYVIPATGRMANTKRFISLMGLNFAQKLSDFALPGSGGAGRERKATLEYPEYLEGKS
jgi:hypothetical protein